MKNRITLLAALILISCAFAFSADMVVNNGYDPGAMRTDGTNADSPVFPGAVTVAGQTTLGNASATVIHVDDGALAAPSLAFAADPGTGLYRAGSGMFNLVSNGVSVAQITPNFIYSNKSISANSAGRFLLSYTAANRTNPIFNFAGIGWTTSGLGGVLGEPSMVASGTEAMRWTATGTISLQPMLVATDTPMAGYAMTIGNDTASSVYVMGQVNCAEVLDHSAAPDTLTEAINIVMSHESKNGKVDHSKLDPAAWGTRFKRVATGRKLTKTRTVDPIEEGGEATVEAYDEPEMVTVSEPDQSTRNVSKSVSALMLVCQELLAKNKLLEDRIKELEKN